MTDKPTTSMTREEWFAWRAKHHPVPKAPPPPFQKTASLTAYRQVIHLFSQACYRMSVPDPKGMDVFLPPDLADAELGRQVRAALAASRFIGPDHPERDSIVDGLHTDERARAWNRRVLDAAGVKTLKALRAGARSVSLTLRDGVITIAPWEQQTRDFWGPLDPSLTLTVPEGTPDEALGQAVREALGRSR